MIGYTLTTELMSKVQSCPYNPKVFILPPWKEIYETDSERKQDWQKAEQTYTQMKIMYERFGYEVINVPTGNINERKEFVLTQVNELKK